MSRAVPYFCPYCGDEDLRPHESDDVRGGWECHACARVFKVTFVGLQPNPPETSNDRTVRSQ